MRPFISLCMIVKNEEKVLERCLQSVEQIVDEMIIVDTGSNDSTKEIAQKYNCNVFDFTWTNNFSEARNYAQAKASGEWILFLDADEYVDRDNLKQVINELKETKTNMDAFTVCQINFSGVFGESIGTCYTARIYKNEPNIKFYRSIHEQLIKEDGNLALGFLNLNIYHSGYLTKTTVEKSKSERNINLLEKEIKVHSNKAYDYMNIGNELFIQGKYDKALEKYRNAFENFGSINNSTVKTLIVERILFCLIELKRYSEGLKVIDSAIETWPLIIDFVSIKGIIYFLQNRIADSKAVLLYVISNKEKLKSVHSIAYSEYLPYKIMGEISELEKDNSSAVRFYSNVLNFNNKDYHAIKNLYKILLKNEKRDNILQFIENQISLKQSLNQYLLLKVLLELGETTLIDILIEKWNIDCSPSLHFKVNMLKNNLSTVENILKKGSIKELCGNEGWTDIFDIIIYSIIKEDRSLIQELKYNYPEAVSLNFLFEENQEIHDLTLSENNYLRLLTKCILVQQFEVIDKIIIQKEVFGEAINIKIGNLFYEHGYKELAMDFYQEIEDISKLDEQAFINVIETFIAKNFHEDALQFCYMALEQNKIDFRIFKATIEILNYAKLDDDKNRLIDLGLQYFPDSKYLLGFKERKHDVFTINTSYNV